MEKVKKGEKDSKGWGPGKKCLQFEKGGQGEPHEKGDISIKVNRQACRRVEEEISRQKSSQCQGPEAAAAHSGERGRE